MFSSPSVYNADKYQKAVALTVQHTFSNASEKLITAFPILSISTALGLGPTVSTMPFMSWYLPPRSVTVGRTLNRACGPKESVKLDDVSRTSTEILSRSSIA